MGEADFEAFCKEHFVSVARTAFLITGDAEEAEDLAQEAFVRAYERWGRISDMDQPGAWVHRTVTNLSISSWRRRRVRSRVYIPSEDVPEPETPDAALADALRALTPAQRAAVVLRYYLDWSATQAAQALGKNASTVRVLTHQGLARLRELIGEGADDDRA
jgi:RNA polymerase sigma-70 factor (sigma-E family)